MLEILLLVYLGKKISANLRAKGIKPGSYQFLLVFLWFGGEVIGYLIGAAISYRSLAAYFCALLGAALGACLTFGIVNAKESTGRVIEHPDADYRKYEEQLARNAIEGRKRL